MKAGRRAKARGSLKKPQANRIRDPQADRKNADVQIHANTGGRIIGDETLRESEKRYRAMFEESIDGVFITSPEGKILDISRAGIKMFGYDTKEEMLRLDLASEVYADLKDRDRVLSAVREHGSAEYEVRVKKKNGEIMLTRCFNAAVKDNDGKLICYRGVIRDITEIWQAEEILARRTRQLEVLARVSQQINTVLEIPDVLRSLVVAAMVLTGATAGTAGLMVEVKMVFTEYNDHGNLFPINYTFESGYGVPGWIITTKEPYISNDVEHDTHVIPEIQKTLGFYNLVDVPILSRKGELIGCFEMHNTADHRPFDKHDVEMLQSLASNAAIALENAQMITERKRAQNIMQARLRLLEFANSHSMDEFLTATLDEIEALTGSSIGFYHFLESDQKTLSLQNWSTNTLKNMCAAAGKGQHYDLDKAGVWVDCIRERRPTIHNDYASLPHRKGMPEGHAPVIREVVVPIFRGNLIKAIIGVGNKSVNYNENDIKIVSQLGDLSWDITERKQAEEALHRLNRKLRAISNCNQTLLRAVDEQTLLKEICRIVCDEAGYMLAWVGYAEHDEAKTVRPVAWAGFESSYIANAQLSWSEDTERGRGSAGIAIRSGEAFYVQDFTTDPRMAPWRESALQRGYLSGIALPLKDDKANVFGVLLIYSAEANAITPDEVHLLEELSGDLAFGITVLRARAERSRTEEALRASESRFRSTLDSMMEGCQIIGFDWRYLYVNAAAAQHGRLPREELIGRTMMELYPGIEDTAMYAVLRRCMQERKSEHMENQFVYTDGSSGWFELSVQPVPEGIFILSIDITERKRLEEELRLSEQRKAIMCKIADVFLLVPDEEMYGKVLAIVLDVMESKFGLFGYIAENGDFVIPSMTRDIWDKCRVADKSIVFPPAAWGKSIWGRAIREKRAFCSDGPFHTPEGHIPIEHFLTVPVVFGNETIGLISVAKVERSYTVEDQSLLESIAGHISPILNARLQRDLQEQKRRKAAEELLRNERRLTRAQRIAHLGSWELDLTTNVLIWSDEVYRIFGLEPQDFAASYEAFMENVHPDDKDYVDAAYINSVRHDVPYDIVHRIIRRSDGAIRYVHEVCENVKDETGKIISSRGTVHDITDLKQAEKKIFQQSEVLAGINKVFLETMTCETDEEVAKKCLAVAEELTGSKYGFIGELNEKGLFDIIAQNAPGWEAFRIDKKTVTGRIKDMDVRGIWGRVLKDGKSLIANDPAAHPDYVGIPEEHPPIASFLGVPIKQGNITIGMIALADKESGYNQDDRENLESLSVAFVEALKRKRAEEKIKASLHEKEVLLKEIHHRVKNNLQVISSLLNLQLLHIENKKAMELLKSSRNRIRTMAFIYESLYQSENLALIDFSEYIRNLVNNLYRSFGADPKKITFKINVKNIHLGIDTAIPCGLIINELFSNALKYAFTEGKKGSIEIIVKKSKDKYILVVSDNGAGIPEEIDIEKTETLGLDLVHSLTEQLDGRLVLDRKKGTKFKIEFVELKYKSRGI